MNVRCPSSINEYLSNVTVCAVVSAVVSAPAPGARTATAANSVDTAAATTTSTLRIVTLLSCT
jgi:hypothetical protein